MTEEASKDSALAKQPSTVLGDFCRLTVYFRFECGFMGYVVYCDLQLKYIRQQLFILGPTLCPSQTHSEEINNNQRIHFYYGDVKDKRKQLHNIHNNSQYNNIQRLG